VPVRCLFFAVVGNLSAYQSNETSDGLVTDDQKLLSETGNNMPAKDAIRNSEPVLTQVNYVALVLSLMWDDEQNLTTKLR